MAAHRGTELNNVKETWQQNEQQDARGARRINTDDPTTVSSDLQETIAAGAAEYDNANKEDRLLDGDRASVNDNDPDR